MDIESSEKKKIDRIHVHSDGRSHDWLVAYLMTHHRSAGISKEILICREHTHDYCEGPITMTSLGTIDVTKYSLYREAFEALMQLKREGRSSGVVRVGGKVVMSFDGDYWSFSRIRIQGWIVWLMDIVEKEA